MSGWQHGVDVRRVRSRITAGAIAAGVIAATLAGCSSKGGGDGVLPERTTTTRGFGVDAPSTTRPSGVTTTTGPEQGPAGPLVVGLEGDIDLDDAPGAVVVDANGGYRIVAFSRLGKKAKVAMELEDGLETPVLSPDGAYLAVAHPGDAVRRSRLELLETTTGDQVATMEVDTSRVTIAQWAPDSSAVLGVGRDAANANVYGVLRTDGSSESPNLERLEAYTWVVGPKGATIPTAAGLSSRIVQLVTTKGKPVSILAYGSGGDMANGVLTPTGVEPFEGPAATGTSGTSGNGWSGGNGRCPRFAYLITDADEPQRLVYDVDTNKAWPVDDTLSFDSDSCPVVSPSGDLAAIPFSDGIKVLDLRNGDLTQVAREGLPIAWSADDEKLLVSGNGTFVVAADGSGGKEAKVEVGSACIVAERGEVIVPQDSTDPSRPDQLVAFDIGSGRATTLGPGQLNDRRCQVSKDGKWLLNGKVLVDLDRGKVAEIQLRNSDDMRIGALIHLPGGQATWLWS